MKHALIGLGGALTVVGLVALVAWLGGYDFDHRSPDVAAAAVFAFTFAAVAGLAGWHASKEAA